MKAENSWEMSDLQYLQTCPSFPAARATCLANREPRTSPDCVDGVQRIPADSLLNACDPNLGHPAAAMETA